MVVAKGFGDLRALAATDVVAVIVVTRRRRLVAF
jgi:hypothetical protein